MPTFKKALSKTVWISPILYVFLVALVATLTWTLGLSSDQVISTTILSCLIFGSLLFWRFRVAFALLGIAALLIAGVLDIPKVVEFAGLDIILFLFGMMLLVGFLEERLFFERLVERLIVSIGANALRLTILLMFLSGIFAALVDEVTSILFMAGMVFQLTSKYRQNPIPFLIMIIFATNIGSSATVVGNPIGIMIALRAGLTFMDFLRWASPIAFIALFLSIGMLTRYFYKSIKGLDEGMKTEGLPSIGGKTSLFSRDFLLPWILFIGTIIALILHSHIEILLGLKKNSMLLGTSLLIGGIILLLERHRARELVERRVEWWTLSFFLLLFASVGTLKLTGVTTVLAQGIISLCGGSERLLFFSLASVAGILSAMMDNVLAIATFIPVIHDLGAMGEEVFPLWWGLLFAGTFCGNLTMIGSTANIVAIGMMEGRGLGHINLWVWIKATFIPSMVTFLLALLFLYIQLLR